MAHQSEYQHIVTGTDSNSVDFSKRMIDIQALEKTKETMYK
jgi:hypothetical protein